MCAEDSEAEIVEIPLFNDMEVEAKVEILAFMRAQGKKPADFVVRQAGLFELPRPRSDGADWRRWRPAARGPAPYVVCELRPERPRGERVPAAEAREGGAPVLPVWEAWA